MPAPTPIPTLEPANPPAPDSQPTGKLLAIYMVGSDLEGKYMAGTQDFRELIEGYQNLPEDHTVEVIVAFGGADKDGWRGVKFADIYQLMDDSEDGRFGNESGSDAYLYRDDHANMDDEDSLVTFLDYLGDEYPDFDTRFLTFWDHGDSYRGFGGDENFDGPPMSMDDIASAFQRSQPGVFDLIGFDACYMASVEVAKVVRPHADYMIASEEAEPGHGWLWSEVIRIYAREDDIAEAGKQMVNNFVQDVHGGGRFAERTLSLVDLSRYENLVAALAPVVSTFGQEFEFRGEYSRNIAAGITKTGAFGKSQRNDSPAFIDLVHLVQLMAQEFAGTEISPSLGDLMDELDRFVVHSNHDGSVPHANGISIAAPSDTDPYYSEYKLQTWLDFQGAYADFRASDTTAPTIIQQTSDSTGATAAFDDDYLVNVTALYGFIEPVEYDDGTVDDVFMVVAELEAQPPNAAGEYFVAEWDQRWFTVEYDPNEITAWIPASFNGRFEDEYGEFSIYTAEIDYYPGDSDEPEYAVLNLLVDENMEVFDHSIQTYQHVYSGPDDLEGTVRFDKAAYQLEVGDAVQFFSHGLNLYDETLDAWHEAGDIVTFVQEPAFQSELLEFEDEAGQLVEYYYALWAEDASGNAVLTDPYSVTP